MSRQAITITRTDGLKVRSVASYRYYVTIPYGDRAKVITRTDNISSAYRSSLRWESTQVWDRHKGRFMSPEDLHAGHRAMLARARRDRRMHSAGINVRW